MTLFGTTARAFPPHRLPLGRAIVLLVGPLPLLFTLRHDPLLAAVAAAIWLFVCVGLAVASLLDWSRMAPQQEGHLPLARLIGRLGVATVGALGIGAGALLLRRAAEAWQFGTLRQGTSVMGAGLAASIIVMGTRLMCLPFRGAR